MPQYFDDDEEDAPSFLGSALGGAALGAGAGGLGAMGLGLMGGYGKYGPRTQLYQDTRSELRGKHQAPPPVTGVTKSEAKPYLPQQESRALSTVFPDLHPQHVETGELPTQHEFARRQAYKALPSGLMWGAGVGTGLGLLRWLIGR